MGGKPGMTSHVGIRHEMNPTNVVEEGNESEPLDRMEESGHDESYANEGCCCKATDLVRDPASS